jgi:hypothetical protein
MSFILCFLAIRAAACQPRTEHASPGPATRSSQAADHALASRPSATSQPAPGTWENAAKGIRVSYPLSWQPRKNPDYELMLIQAGGAGEDPRITIDIPDLPPHLPWMIQMSRIEHDYLADLKKSHPDLKLEETTDAKVPNATARLVRSTWHEDRIMHEDVVLFMIHANAVYILDARADAQHLSAARSAFDSIEASIHWTK